MAEESEEEKRGRQARAAAKAADLLQRTSFVRDEALAKLAEEKGLTITLKGGTFTREQVEQIIKELNKRAGKEDPDDGYGTWNCSS